jgi:hypothetical protein
MRVQPAACPSCSPIETTIVPTRPPARASAFESATGADQREVGEALREVPRNSPVDGSISSG